MTDTSTSPLPLRQALRTHTQPAHARLDQAMAELGSLSTAEGYCRYLQVMQALHAGTVAAEQQLSRVDSNFQREVSVGFLVEQDLKSLGYAHLELADWPSADLALPQTESELWGQAYVVEGSALGARYLLTRMEREQHFPQSRAYLTQMAADAVHRWPRFVTALEQSGADTAAATRAAATLFENTHALVIRLCQSAERNPGESA